MNELEAHLYELVRNWKTEDYIASRKDRNWNLYNFLSYEAKIEARIQEAEMYNKTIKL